MTGHLHFDSREIHARIGPHWPMVLEQLGTPGTGTKKAGPCHICGGTDRFVGDNRNGRGDYFCRGCGPGDGFDLLMKFHRWDFREARRRVLDLIGVALDSPRPASAPIPAAPTVPSRRVRDVLRHACATDLVESVVEYLRSRALWPLPADCSLEATPSIEYWHEQRRQGLYSAILARVLDGHGELVSAHATYLETGRKLCSFEPRKLLGPLGGKVGCAVRLMPLAGDVLGVGEGLETCLSASKLLSIPCWAALNTTLLAKFEPPEGVRTLIVCADRDEPGLAAAARLMERLQGRVTFELKVPPPPAKDWNDVLLGCER